MITVFEMPSGMVFDLRPLVDERVRGIGGTSRSHILQHVLLHIPDLTAFQAPRATTPGYIKLVDHRVPPADIVYLRLVSPVLLYPPPSSHRKQEIPAA